jgi:fructokinase
MSKTGFKTLIFGELLWDLFPSGPVLGGAPANFALRLQSLGNPTFLCSRVGNDQLGRTALEEIRSAGLNTELIQIDPQHPTGTVKITLNAEGEPDYEIIRNAAYDRIELSQPLEEIAATADCIYFGTLAQRDEQSRRTIYQLLDSNPNSIRLLDINLRRDCYSSATIQSSLERATILKLNDSEVETLSKLIGLPPNPNDLLETVFHKFPLEICVVTLGEHGVVARQGNGNIITVPGYSVQVCDTCGAGDAFTAGFMHSYFKKASLEESCLFGNALGALVAATEGATTPITLKQIEDLKKSNIR